ncbi:hypothetical protein [Pedococcus sp. 5OH_020]|uniref:hypothetical protein n=1 Tax=Pedococcus sp. 5OH_020 TaxID=2989814 RepID=UPI0022E99B5F|nr:hypothetical protein [Pedococcus sp. 5OH_020]
MTPNNGAPAPRVPVRQRSSLAVVEGGDSGGQGRVRLLRDRSDLVYKEFHDAGKLDRGAMDRILRLPATMSEADRSTLLCNTAWPVERVDDGSRFVGFLMGKIPSEFWYEDPVVGHRLLEFQHLMFPPRATRKAVPEPSTAQRLAILRSAAEIFAFLHGHSFIVGDVSMKNIVWSLSPRPRAFLIDCDGCRKVSYLPVLHQADTPEWDDPLRQGNTSTEASDRYKLALLIGRGLNVRYSWRPTDPDPFGARPDLPEKQRQALTRLSQAAAGPLHTRPSAAEWASALGDRPMIRLSAPGPSTNGAVHQPTQPNPRNPARPKIRLRETP